MRRWIRKVGKETLEENYPKNIIALGFDGKEDAESLVKKVDENDNVHITKEKVQHLSFTDESESHKGYIEHYDCDGTTAIEESEKVLEVHKHGLYFFMKRK